MNQAIAFFDFDGTITRKDTLIEIIKYQKGSFGLYAGLFILSPVLILLKLKLLHSQKAKEIVLKYFFRNTPVLEFQKKCDLFTRDVLPGLIRPSALNCLHDHLKKGTKIVIVSASAENWLSGWCNELNISYIGTKLEVRQGKISGKIAGKNCYGIEKVNRIKAAFNLNEFKKIYAYGDSAGDVPMLKIATDPRYRTFT